MNKHDYYVNLKNKYGSDLNKLIEDFGIDGNRGYQTQFKNKEIQDSVDDLFRMLFNLNQDNAISDSFDRDHTIEKTLGILSNYYVLDATLLNHENGSGS